MEQEKEEGSKTKRAVLTISNAFKIKTGRMKVILH